MKKILAIGFSAFSFFMSGCQSAGDLALVPPGNSTKVPITGTSTRQLYWAMGNNSQSSLVHPADLPIGRRVVTVYEPWIGLPPLLGTSYNTPITRTAGEPIWWNELAAMGFYANGMVTIAKYPGGWEAYYNRYIYPCVHVGLYDQVLGRSSNVVRADYDQLLADFDLDIMVDIEGLWPVITAWEAQWPGTNSSYWMEYCRRELAITDFDTCAARYQAIAQPLYTRMLQEYHSLMPKAKVSWYAMPMGAIAYTWVTDPAAVAEFKHANRVTLSWLWALLDYLVPCHYQYYQVGSDDGRVAGEMSASDYINLRRPFAEEVRELSQILGKPVIPVLSPFYLFTARAPYADSPLLELDWYTMMQLSYLSGADHVMFWGSPGWLGSTAEPFNQGFLNGRRLLAEFLSGASSATPP